MTSKADIPFKTQHPFAKRAAEAQRIRDKYPGRLAVIVERRAKDTTGVPLLDKKKYLVPRDLTVGQMLYVVRKRIKLPAETGLFLSAEKETMQPPSAELLAMTYERCKDKDGFLYLQYSGENAFG